jgi:hypothetical protein
LDELLDRLRLIPFGFEFRDDFEIGHKSALYDVSNIFAFLVIQT